MAKRRRKSRHEEPQPPKYIAGSNFDAAVDQTADYDSLAHALAAYRVNVGDTVVESYGKANVRALHTALRTYDRSVTKLWKQLEDHAEKASVPAKWVFSAWVKQQRSEYEHYFGRRRESRYGDIETEANPSHTQPGKSRKGGREKRSSKKRNPVSVRKLVNDAMK